MDDKKILLKIHSSYRWVVAVCDSDLIGKKFREGKAQLDLTGDFFRGEEKTPEEAKDIIFDAQKEDATFFIVGSKSIALAKKIGLIEEGGVKKVEGIEMGLVLL